MSAPRVVVIGAGGHGKVVVDAILSSAMAPGSIVGLVDSDPALVGREVMGYHVVPDINDLGPDRFDVVIAVGDNAVRRRLFDELTAAGHTPVSVIHPRAVIAATARIGRGVVVFANAVVNPGTVIADNVILNTACSVDHDCIVGAHAHLAPGVSVSGGVTIGAGTLIGVGASVAPGAMVGAWATVGAGAVVLKTVPPRATAVGVPARVIRWKEPVRE